MHLLWLSCIYCPLIFRRPWDKAEEEEEELHPTAPVLDEEDLPLLCWWRWWLGKCEFSIRFSPGCSGSPVITFVIWKKGQQAAQRISNYKINISFLLPSPRFFSCLFIQVWFSDDIRTKMKNCVWCFFPWMRKTFCRTEVLFCFLLSSLGWNRFSPGCSEKKRSSVLFSSVLLCLL